MTEVKEFVKDVVGIIEATHNEYYYIYKMFSKNYKTSEILTGLGVTVGRDNKRPVCIAIRKAIIDGHTILFYYPTSNIVNHKMIDKWLETNLPDVARRNDGFLNKTDAANASNVIHQASWKKMNA